MAWDCQKVCVVLSKNTVLFYHESKTCFDLDFIRILKWFKSVSGLDINNDKTKVVKIGASRDSNIPWQGKFGFKWSETFEILGIHYNIKTFNEITELNIFRKMGEIKKLIKLNLE